MRSKRYWFLPLCLFVAVMVLTSSVSYAADDYRILWGPNPVPGVTGGGGGGHPIEVSEGSTGGTSGSETSTGTQSQYYGVIVYANTKYNAALLTLGYDPNDSRFTDEIKVKLKVPKFGGKFTEFAQSFDDLEGSDGKMQTPQFYDSDFTNRIMIYPVCANATSLYGAKNVWSNLYTESEASFAKLAVELLLSDDAGGSGGGSGSGTVTGDTVTLTLCPQGIARQGRMNNTMFSGVSEIKVKLPSSVVSDVNNGAILVLYAIDSNNVSLNVVVGLDDCDAKYDVRNYPTYLNFYAQFTNNTGISINWVNKYNNLYVGGTSAVDGVITFDFINNNYVTENKTLSAGASYFVPKATNSSTYDIVGYYDPRLGGGGGSDDPVTDPDPDPDPDPVTPRPDLPTPDPPVLPDPPDDPVVPDPPTLPDPKNPIIPSTPTPDVDTGTYTPDLSGILDAMTQHCQHLQAKMIECSEYQAQYFEYVFDGFQDDLFSYLQGAVDYIVGSLGGITTEGDYTQVGNWISWLGESIHADFGYLLDYLEALWSWLKDSLVVDFTGVGSAYDDSSLIGWLEKIYLKLGEGFNFTPTDPVTNPGDTGSWLDQFLGSFFGSLLGNLAGVLADAAGALGTLATKFPFCIPWDIMAILGLLASPPVCPVITLPCYSLTSSGLQEVGTYVIDLHDIEFAVEGIRWMFKLGFILVLANRTKDWLEMLEGVMG